MISYFTNPLQRFKTKRYYQFEDALETLSKLLANSHMNAQKNRDSYNFYKNSIQDANKALQLSIIEIYDDISDLDADCLVPVLQKLIHLINSLQSRVMADNSTIETHEDAPLITNTQNGLCLECHELLQQKRIEKIFKKFHISKSQKKFAFSKQHKKYLCLDQEDEENFSADEQQIMQQKNYINKIEQILNSQAKFIITNKNYDSITRKYLMNESRSFLDITGIDMSELVQKAREDFKLFSQVNWQENQNLTEKIFQSISKIIENFMRNTLEKIVLKCVRGAKAQVYEIGVQTEEIDLMSVIENLKKNLEMKDKIITRLRQAKYECQSTIIKYIERQQQLQLKTLEFKQKYAQIQQKLTNFTEKNNELNKTHKEEMHLRQKQIQKLKKTITEQKNHLVEKQGILASIPRKTLKKLTSMSHSTHKASISRKSINQGIDQQVSSSSKKILGMLESQFNRSRSQKNGDGMKKSSSKMRIIQKERNPKVSGFYDPNGMQILLEKKISEEKSNEQDNTINIKQIDSDDEDILNLPQAEVSLNRLQENDINSIHSPIHKSAKKFSILSQYSMEIAQNKTKQQCSLDPNGICESLLGNFPQSRSSRRDSKSKIGYRIFKPSRVNLLREQKEQQRNNSYDSTNMKMWMNKVFELNKENMKEKACMKKQEAFIGNIYGDRIIKTENNELFSQDFIPKIEKLNASRVTISAIKQKNRKCVPFEKTQSQKLLTEKSSKKLEPLLNHTHLYLFGGQKSALDYEKNSGIWPHLYTADKLILDFQNTYTANQIQKFFNELADKSPQKYTQFIAFLFYPITYLSQIKNEHPLPTVQLEKNSIRVLFNQIIRFHRINHKNCTHVIDFLTEIGFQEL